MVSSPAFAKGEVRALQDGPKGERGKGWSKGVREEEGIILTPLSMTIGAKGRGVYSEMDDQDDNKTGGKYTILTPLEKKRKRIYQSTHPSPRNTPFPQHDPRTPPFPPLPLKNTLSLPSPRN